jgi:hypothetical protein
MFDLQGQKYLSMVKKLSISNKIFQQKKFDISPLPTENYISAFSFVKQNLASLPSALWLNNLLDWTGRSRSAQSMQSTD